MSESIVKVVLFGTGKAADDLAEAIKRKNVDLDRQSRSRGRAPKDLLMVVSWGKDFNPEPFSGEEAIRDAIADLPPKPAGTERPLQPRPTQRGPGRGRRPGGLK